ncbi:MAG: CDP-diacylglycerol--serine O-phosphatidyltransferase [Flavobacteriales bacterium]|nr:CDP-diacylglycerol--serine O-phosphatidyltransferase [Flavobacteriales bacterium]
MQIRSQIPNLFTLGNLFCGILAIIYAFQWELSISAYLVLLAAVLDFFDGFLARLLKVSGDMGKQLDSLADMVSFGVVPGIIVFQLMKLTLFLENPTFVLSWNPFLFIPLIIPLLSAYRLAKFNIDTRQSDSFIGVPTPANTLFFIAFPLMLEWDGELVRHMHIGDEVYSNFMPQMWFSFNPFENNEWSGILLNRYFLSITAVIMSFLLIAEIPLFALKFKSFGWKGNEIRFSFLAVAAALLIIFQFVAIPIIILLYILISILKPLIFKS